MSEGMTYVKTAKGRVAVEPFPDMSVKTKIEGTGAVKVARIENKTALEKLRVIFDCEDGRFKAGDYVLVKGSHFSQHWAKEVHNHLGYIFILMPDNFVEVISGA